MLTALVILAALIALMLSAALGLLLAMTARAIKSRDGRTADRGYDPHAEPFGEPYGERHDV